MRGAIPGRPCSGGGDILANYLDNKSSSSGNKADVRLKTHDSPLPWEMIRPLDSRVNR